MESTTLNYVLSDEYRIIFPGERDNVALLLSQEQRELLKSCNVIVQSVYDLAFRGIIVLYHNLNCKDYEKFVVLQNSNQITQLNAHDAMFGPRERCEIKKGNAILEVRFVIKN